MNSPHFVGQGSNPYADESSIGENTCVEGSESAEQVMTRLRGKKAEVTAEETPWMDASLCALTDHIRSKHHQYVRSALPEVQAMLATVSSDRRAEHPELAKVERIFVQIGRDMIAHMQKEELILFPYIEALERSKESKGTLEVPFFQTVRNPIQVMMKEHETAENLFTEIRQEIHNYAPPTDACLSHQSLLRALRTFDDDFRIHSHLEDAILFPRAAELEVAQK